MGIEQYLEEKGVRVPGGSGWKPMKCPYHTDRTASASVNLGLGKYHCFVCDISEDLIGLIRRDTGMSYVEAQQEAESKYGQSRSEVHGRNDPRLSLLPRRAGNQSDRRGTVPTRHGSGWREGL